MARRSSASAVTPAGPTDHAATAMPSAAESAALPPLPTALPGTRASRALANALACGAVALAATGCQTAPKPLYHWQEFPRQQYQTLLMDGSDPQAQIQTLEAQAEKARAGNLALPPGFRAHLGLMYLNVGNPDQARALFEAERASFPESAVFIDSLLRRMDGKTAAAQGKKS